MANSGAGATQALLSTVLLACVAAPANADPLSIARWTEVTSAAAFSERDCAGPLVFDGKMWLLGGWNGSASPPTNSEIWSSVDGVDWTLETIAPWEGRHCAGYAVWRDKMWVLGGDTNRSHYQNDVWSSPDGIQWTQVAADVPWRDRVTHYVLVFDDSLWVLGGQQIEPNGTAVYHDVWSSSDGENWTLVTEHAPWKPRGQIVGAAVFRDKMWIIGGGTYNDPRQYYSDVWSSADGVNWQRVVGVAPWKPRQYHNVAVFDDKLWVLGGYNKINLGDVWYSSDGAKWHQLQGPTWYPRHAGSVLVFDGSLWMIGGSVNGSYPRNDVWRLSLATSPPCAPAPLAGCTRSGAPRSSLLRLYDRSSREADRLTWTWSKGPELALTDFGDPANTTGYALCVYDASSSLVMETGALAGCVGSDCWNVISRGFARKVSQRGLDGKVDVLLQAGPEGRTRISFSSEGADLGLPLLDSLTPPLTVQLQASEGGRCWEASYSSGRLAGAGAGRLLAFSALGE